MLVRFFWGSALFFLGVVVGLIVTVIDCLVIGSASFLAHISLWMLINVLLAVHVSDGKRAMIWSIPLNVGYVASYYMATAATYEGYARSLIVSVSALAFLAPAFVYGVWVAKDTGGIYAFLMSLLSAGGTLFVSYLLNGEVSGFAAVVAILIVLFVGILPTKRLKVTPAPHPTPDSVPEAEMPTRDTADRFARRGRVPLVEADSIDEEMLRSRQARSAEGNVYEDELTKPRATRPTKRAKVTKRTRQSQGEQMAAEQQAPESRRRSFVARDQRRPTDERANGRDAADERIARGTRDDRRARGTRDGLPPDPVRPPTLGNTQTPTRSRRSSSRTA